MSKEPNSSKITNILSEAESKLKQTSGTPRLDAEILLAKVLDTSRFGLLTMYRGTVDAKQRQLFESFVARRMKFEPVAYITNEKEFFEDTFFVDDRVLVPRPESEFTVEEAVLALKTTKKSKVLDICCGSGCIGFSIKRVTDCALTLSDISENALDVAKINATRLFPDKNDIVFIQSDLFENISGKFDLITANPPYLSRKDMKNFVVRELSFEPENAFYGGDEGFDITEKIIKKLIICDSLFISFFIF